MAVLGEVIQSEELMKLAKIVKQCRIDEPKRFRLADRDPAERFGLSIRHCLTILASFIGSSRCVTPI